MMIIMLSFDNHHHEAELTHNMLYFLKRRGLKVLKYDILVCHYCCLVHHILKPYTFVNQSFAQVYIVQLCYGIGEGHTKGILIAKCPRYPIPRTKKIFQLGHFLVRFYVILFKSNLASKGEYFGAYVCQTNLLFGELFPLFLQEHKLCVLNIC